jgi:urease accessory protein
LVAAVLTPAGAWAHADLHPGGGFVAGFLHPISGLDHGVAMVAVGLWGAVLGPPALWLLPLAFPPVMALGGLLALLGVPLPGVEVGIALSGLVMGLMVLFELRPPLWLAALIVATFAVFHGHAHGAELPAGANALLYSLAFVIATGLLHLVGILIGEGRRWPGGRALVRLAGAGVALVGVWFLERALV